MTDKCPKLLLSRFIYRRPSTSSFDLSEAEGCCAINAHGRSARDGTSRIAADVNSPASSPAVFSLQTRDEEDPFYAGCHTTKNCFGAPAGCIKTKDCVAVVAVIVEGDQYLFEMQARGNAKYVAVGLSDDKNMVIARRC